MLIKVNVIYLVNKLPLISLKLVGLVDFYDVSTFENKNYHYLDHHGFYTNNVLVVAHSDLLQVSLFIPDNLLGI